MSGFGDALRDVGWYDRMQNRSAQRNVQGAVSITGPVGSQRQRKAIYEELHPETRHGGDRKSDQVANSAIRFTATASEATGKSERTVRIAAARGEALGEDLATVTGTSLDKGVELDELRRSAAAKRIRVDDFDASPRLNQAITNANDHATASITTPQAKAPLRRSRR